MRRNQVNKECPLTKAEHEVLSWLSYGKTYEEIAEIMGLSSTAVGGRISFAMARAGASNSTGLVAMALRKGWIE